MAVNGTWATWLHMRRPHSQTQFYSPTDFGGILATKLEGFVKDIGREVSNEGYLR